MGQPRPCARVSKNDCANGGLIGFYCDAQIRSTGFTLDLTNLGHYGTGDREITIGSMADPERAKPLC